MFSKQPILDLLRILLREKNESYERVQFKSYFKVILT